MVFQRLLDLQQSTSQLWNFLGKPPWEPFQWAKASVSWEVLLAFRRHCVEESKSVPRGQAAPQQRLSRPVDGRGGGRRVVTEHVLERGGSSDGRLISLFVARGSCLCFLLYLSCISPSVSRAKNPPSAWAKLTTLKTERGSDRDWNYGGYSGQPWSSRPVKVPVRDRALHFLKQTNKKKRQPPTFPHPHPQLLPLPVSTLQHRTPLRMETRGHEPIRRGVSWGGGAQSPSPGASPGSLGCSRGVRPGIGQAGMGPTTNSWKRDDNSWVKGKPSVTLTDSQLGRKTSKYP